MGITRPSGLPLRKLIDLPPIWLFAFCVAAYVQARYFPLGVTLGSGWPDFLGGLCVGAGLVLMLLAVTEMRKQRTTVMPHMVADHLVQTGIFKRSRNPIYLGDLLVLFGLILRWDAIAALPLIPMFVWIIKKRFIIPEEDRLRRKFQADFTRYSQKTPRWFWRF